MSGLGGAPAALPGVDAGRCRRRTGRGIWANDVYRRTRRAAASQEGCQFPADDKGKKISLLATFIV
jgi:hypothetical protein